MRQHLIVRLFRFDHSVFHPPGQCHDSLWRYESEISTHLVIGSGQHLI